MPFCNGVVFICCLIQPYGWHGALKFGIQGLPSPALMFTPSCRGFDLAWLMPWLSFGNRTLLHGVCFCLLRDPA